MVGKWGSGVGVHGSCVGSVADFPSVFVLIDQDTLSHDETAIGEELRKKLKIYRCTFLPLSLWGAGRGR